ncbi:hypothetical protein ACOBQB_14175 [Streptomyces sp. G5(2025)]
MTTPRAVTSAANTADRTVLAAELDTHGCALTPRPVVPAECR